MRYPSSRPNHRTYPLLFLSKRARTTPFGFPCSFSRAPSLPSSPRYLFPPARIWRFWTVIPVLLHRAFGLHRRALFGNILQPTCPNPIDTLTIATEKTSASKSRPSSSIHQVCRIRIIGTCTPRNIGLSQKASSLAVEIIGADSWIRVDLNSAAHLPLSHSSE